MLFLSTIIKEDERVTCDTFEAIRSNTSDYFNFDFLTSHNMADVDGVLIEVISDAVLVSY